MFREKQDGGGMEKIARLEEELQMLRARLEGKAGSKRPIMRPSGRRTDPSGRKRKRRRSKKTARRQQRALTATLAPGHLTTTVRGSLYNSILRSMARISKLELHVHFFNEFKKRPTLENARKLLESIGVYRMELQQMLSADMPFREHQRRRTTLLKNRAARGDLKAKGILGDPKISDGRGNWRGDLDEALNILYGARRLEQWQRGKNVRILKRARNVRPFLPGRADGSLPLSAPVLQALPKSPRAGGGINS